MSTQRKKNFIILNARCWELLGNGTALTRCRKKKRCCIVAKLPIRLRIKGENDFDGGPGLSEEFVLKLFKAIQESISHQDKVLNA
jgi:hypothetical protein